MMRHCPLNRRIILSLINQFTLDEQFYVTTSNIMLQVIVESVTSLDDNQMYLLYLT